MPNTGYVTMNKSGDKFKKKYNKIDEVLEYMPEFEEEIKERVHNVEKEQVGIIGRIDTLEKVMNERFNTIDEKFTGKFNTLNEKINSVRNENRILIALVLILIGLELRPLFI